MGSVLMRVFPQAEFVYWMVTQNKISRRLAWRICVNLCPSVVVPGMGTT